MLLYKMLWRCELISYLSVYVRGYTVLCTAHFHALLSGKFQGSYSLFYMVKWISVGFVAESVSNLDIMTDSNQALYEQYLSLLQKPQIYVKKRVMHVKKKKKVKYLLHNWYVFYSSKLGILAIKNHPFWDVLKQNMYLIVKHTFICDLSLCHMMCCKQFLEYNIMHVLFYFRIYWEQCPVTPVFATYKVQVSQDYDEFFVG